MKDSVVRVVLCVCCGATVYMIGTAYPYCNRCLSLKCRRYARLILLGPQQHIERSWWPRMPCGWGCGAVLTHREMRRHFTDCPRRPVVPETVRPAKPNRGGRPPGPHMLCGWRCGAKLTATKMRKHFAHCSRRPKASGGVFV